VTINSKTQRRVRLFVAAILLLGVGITVAYFVRKRQITDRVLRDRDLGFAALEAGDYFNALHKIGPYVQRNPTDINGLVKYAMARRNVEEPNAKHLSDAISLYRRVLEQNPEHPDARERLLEIYLAVGFNTEILTTTDRWDDAKSLRARSIALANLGRDDEARSTAQRYLALKPDDLRMHMFLVAQMQRARVPAEEIVAYAAKLAAAYPNDPRHDLLTAFAYGVTENRDQALKYTLKATSQTFAEPEHVEIAVDLLDSLDREDESLALLSRAANVGKDKQSQRRMIARLYQSRQFALVDERVAKLAEVDPNLSAELLAHRAMALQALDRHDDAGAVIGALAGRKNDFAAAAWVKVLRVLPKGKDPPDDRAIIEACREGLRGETDNPYFRLYLGDAYHHLGENDMATREWSRAAAAASVWGEPLDRLLQLMIVSAQPESVRAAAARLKRLSPADPNALAVVSVAEARLTNRRDPSAVADLMRLLDRVQELSPGESSTLQLKISLLGVTDRAEEAKRLITDQLAPDRKLPPDGYLSMARASEAYGLGLEQLSFERCRSVHGTNFDLAIAEAVWMARTGRTADALRSFEAAREKAADRDRVTWRVAWVQLLDGANDERAGPLWVELADAFPDNASVQRAALASRSVQGNRDLQRRVIDRLKSVVGANGVGWRLAEARWMLGGIAALTSEQDRQRDLVKATSLMNDLVQQYPEQLDARLLLADCLLRLDKKDEAITQLTAAVRLAPGSFTPTMQLASLLQAKGEFDQAKPHLEQAERILERSSAPSAPVAAGEPLRPNPAANAGTAPDQDRAAAWRLIASLYAQRGDTAQAVEVLQRIGGDQSTESDIAMAELLSRRGELSDQACRKLLEKPTLAGIELVAEQYARTGRISEAESVLSRLDTLEAKPGERELVRGLYYQRRMKFAAAIAELQQATQSLAADEKAWRGLIQSTVLEGKGTEAAEAAVRASVAIPGNAAFKRLADNQELVREATTTQRLRPLLASLAESTDGTDQLLAALRIARDALANGKTVTEVLTALRPIAERSPTLAVLQYLIADMQQVMGNYDGALTTVTRLMQLLPNDPQPAQRATEILAATGRWREMIPVAQQWRKRLGAVSLPADEALATAYVATGQYDAALSQLDSYAALAAAAPNDWVRTISLRAQTLIGLQRTNDAEAVLFPSMSTNAAIRESVIRIAVGMIQDPTVSIRWLEQGQAAMPPDAIDERLAVAQAWLELSARPGQKAVRSRVDELMKDVGSRLEAKPDARSESWVVLGMLKERTGDAPGAESAYRAAIRITPQQSVAKNNLAMLLLSSSGQLDEALQLAEAAAKDEKDPSHSEYLDTLAQVQSKAGRHDAAERSLRRAVELAPQNLVMRATLVQILLNAQKFPEARQTFDELEGMSASARQANEPLDARLKALAASLASSPSNK